MLRQGTLTEFPVGGGAETKPVNQRWEYLVAEVHVGNGPEVKFINQEATEPIQLHVFLNQKGGEGWDVVGIADRVGSQDQAGFIIIMKRLEPLIKDFEGEKARLRQLPSWDEETLLSRR